MGKSVDSVVLHLTTPSPTSIVRRENPFEPLGELLVDLVGVTREAIELTAPVPAPALDAPSTPAELLTVSEAAKLLRINPKTAYELISLKKLPATKVGGSVRLHREALLEWLKNGGTAPSKKAAKR